MIMLRNCLIKWKEVKKSLFMDESWIEEQQKKQFYAYDIFAKQGLENYIQTFRSGITGATDLNSQLDHDLLTQYFHILLYEKCK